MKRALFSLLLACTPTTAPTPTPPPSPPASASASASAPAPAPSPPPVSGTPHSYASLCPDVPVDVDGGAARPPMATDLMVNAKLRTVKKDFVASIAVPAKRVDREVFRMGTEGDPFQCCTRASQDALDVSCMFSGIDVIEAHARATVEGDAVVIRWCKANLSTGQQVDRGEERVPRSGANAWFGASTPACAPKMPQ